MIIIRIFFRQEVQANALTRTMSDKILQKKIAIIRTHKNRCHLTFLLAFSTALCYRAERQPMNCRCALSAPNCPAYATQSPRRWPWPPISGSTCCWAAMLCSWSLAIFVLRIAQTLSLCTLGIPHKIQLLFGITYIRIVVAVLQCLQTDTWCM